MSYFKILNESESVHDFLEKVIQIKKAKNSKLSLRAIAKHLDFDHAASLSLILRGQRKLSAKQTVRLATALNLNQDETLFLKTLNRFDQTDNNADKTMFRDILEQMRRSPVYKEVHVNDLSREIGWEDFVILCLVNLPAYQENHQLFAEKFSSHISTSMKRLKRAKLVSSSRDGRITPTEQFLRIVEVDKRTKSRNIQKAFIDRALQALEKQPSTESSFSSYMVVTTKDKIAEARRRIDDFRLKMGEFLETAGGDEIYLLNIQLFDLLKSMTAKS